MNVPVSNINEIWIYDLKVVTRFYVLEQFGYGVGLGHSEKIEEMVPNPISRIKYPQEVPGASGISSYGNHTAYQQWEIQCRFILLLLVISLLLIGCKTSNEFYDYSKSKKAIKVLRYVYKPDISVNDTGYWPSDAWILQSSEKFQLAGSISEFRNIYPCENFQKLQNKFEAPEKARKQESVEKVYFVDPATNDLYYIIKLKGSMSIVKKDLCGSAQTSWRIRSNCINKPNSIQSYPYVIFNNYSYSELHNIDKVKRLLEIGSLKLVQPDSAKFRICY